MLLALCVLLPGCGSVARSESGPATAGSAATTGAAAPDEARLWEAARLRGQALAEMEDGDYARAAELLRRLAELLPDNVLPPVNLAISYYRLDRPDEALAEIERARALAPDNPQALYTLARVLESAGRRQRWEGVLAEFARAHPRDPRPYWLRAVDHEREGRHADAAAAFNEALRRAPDNLVLMVELLVAAAHAGELETASDALDAIEDRLNGFDGSLLEYAERLRELLDAGRTDGLRPPATVVRNLLRPTDLYQLGLIPLTGGRQPGGALFPQQDFEPPLPPSIQGGQDIEVAFVDATAASGLETVAGAAGTVRHVEPARSSEVDELLLFAESGVVLLTPAAGELVASPVTVDGAGDPDARPISFDLDQDELTDLAMLEGGRRVWLRSGLAGGGFGPARIVFELPGAAAAAEHGEPPASAEQGAAQQQDAILRLFPVDADHDGDLDLLALRAGTDLVLQNNGDGTWSERADAAGLAGPPEPSADLAVADFDDDGDLDLLLAHPSGAPRLYLNGRAGTFENATERFGLAGHSAGFSRAIAADFDNDGLFDLLLAGERAGLLLRNAGGRFEPVAWPVEAADGWRAAVVGDFDNDGDQDIAAATAGTGELRLLRNLRDGFRVEPTALVEPDLADLVAADLDDDGDLDLLARTGSGRLRLWRNEGGHRNHWLRLRLRGKSDNNSKNNTQGLHNRIETRVGDAYQAVLGSGGVNHLGLGSRRQADVVRVVWTNGLAQTWQAVSANRTMDEEQVLKGSCPFLYAWNGERFEFVTDLMWKSPLGMILPDGSPASHHSARDWVLVPGEALRPAGGELWLQTTEELWETAYVDRQRLLAVDSPPGARLVVDERFLPPPYAAEPPLHWLGETRRPDAAWDQAGRDQLALVSARDDRHVDDLPLARYQGLTHGHALYLRFDDVPAAGRLRLVLWGWTFPTDTSINFALAQNGRLESRPPTLEVRRPGGRWRVLEPFLGFPNGKRKAMVVELGGRVPAGDLELRIATTMQIYWDAALLAVGDPLAATGGEAPVLTPLEPRTADLHYRGFSRLYRESVSGPHLFNYADVDTAPRFRDLAGAYTRFGRVEKLLAAEDDRYVVMNAGDEMTVRFDATALPPLAAGWRRDWVLYTDGWVKDGDLHTRHSQTVEPLPYHGMSAYPDQPRHAYPEGPEHESYRARYQTREVSDLPFRRLRPGRP